MFLPDDYEQPKEQECSEMSGRQLCYLFGNALLSSEERLWYESNWYKFTEEKAREHINKLIEMMPIMGLHSWPHSIDEFKRAIQYQVDKDTLHELRFKK